MIQNLMIIELFIEKYCIFNFLEIIHGHIKILNILIRKLIYFFTNDYSQEQ
jgi:hypothetical protein